jgi:3-oxoacyl-[acyl-carrier-protein] synthase-1
MESVAIKRTNLQNVPVNSLKSYFGHSLGATGVIETALAIYSAQNNIAFKTLGFETPGTIEKINVLNKHKNIEINNVLKIASGFGGSNAALLFSKNK